MNENEQILETFIKQQQEMINDLSQKNVMLNTKVKYLEQKTQNLKEQESTINELKREKLKLERKVESLTNNNKVLCDRIKNNHRELQQLQESTEQKKLINKRSLSGFSATLQRK